MMQTDVNDIAAIGELPRKRRPEPYENLPGFILRHTELMVWEKITWLLEYAKISKDKRHHTPYTFVFDPSLDLSTLGHVTCNNPVTLKSMTYPQSDDKEGTVSFMGHNITIYALTMTKPKICPQCLRQGNYIRAMWDLSLVTCCPVHKCMLVDTCPQCGRKLSWHRNKVSGCVDDINCGFDFRDMPDTAIESGEAHISKHIYSLLNVHEIHSYLSEDNPINKLSLDSFINFVAFFSVNHGININLNGSRLFFKSTSIIERHNAINTVSDIFYNWPIGFFRLLDDLKSQAHNSPQKYGLSHDFGKTNIEKFRKAFFNAEFDFVREAFESYLQNWDGGYINSRNKWIKGKARQTDTIGIEEACSTLKTTRKYIDNWIELGYLRANVIHSGKRRLVRINLESLETFQRQRSKWIGMKDVAAQYDMDRTFIYNIVQAKIPKAVSGPNIDGSAHYYFTPEAVQKLYIDIFGIIYKHGCKYKNRKLICFKKAQRLLKYKKYSWIQLIRMILSAKIIPYAIGPNAGLNCFLFDEQVIESIEDNKNISYIPGEMSVAQASDQLMLSRDSIYYLIKVGVLKANRPDGYKRLLAITVNSINKFQSSYIVANKLADQLDLHIHRLINILRAKGIRPVSGVSVNRARLTLYKKEDIDSIDLEKSSIK